MIEVLTIASGMNTCTLMGCSNSFGTMLDDYNSHFTINDKGGNGQPSPGDADFVANMMLYSTYCVSSEDTLNLSAPYNCNRYSWVVTKFDDETETPVEINYFNGTSGTTRDFATYIPESGLEVGKTYKLTLTIEDMEGSIYSDICELVIYQHYDF